jgi:hypothetical protein
MFGHSSNNNSGVEIEKPDKGYFFLVGFETAALAPGASKLTV